MAINSQRLRTTRQMVESKFSRRQLLALLAGGVLATLPASCSPGSSNDSRLGPSGHVDGEALHYASLRDVARLIETKQVSPVELTRMMLDRIAALDRRLDTLHYASLRDVRPTDRNKAGVACRAHANDVGPHRRFGSTSRVTRPSLSIMRSLRLMRPSRRFRQGATGDRSTASRSRSKTSATPKAYVRWEASGSWPTLCRTSMQR